MNKTLCLLGIFAVGFTLSGCAEQRPPEFEPNIVTAYATELSIGYPMGQALDEAQAALTQYFGTPDAPEIPDFLEGELASLVSLDRLNRAAGMPDDSGHGLYRKHCVTCHGITGNGRGPNAAISSPYPRDFRMGKFKFKSTARGAKPLLSDLHATIANGIAGTTMVRIPELTEDDLATLVDYVVYLSWRGEVERELLRAAEDIEFETPVEEGSEPEEVESTPAEDEELVLKNLYAPGTPLFEEEQLPLVKRTIEEVAQSWLDAGEHVKEVPDAGDIPVHATLDELIAAAQGSVDSPLKKSIERGRELFASEIASCSKCHGAGGFGDGQTQDFDDWTKDWTGRAQLDATDEQALIPLLARGALPPRKILPRDFREGIYRGGDAPEKLYHRIAYGIDGTPMPAVDGVVPPEDIWHLVNFVRSLAEPPKP